MIPIIVLILVFLLLYFLNKASKRNVVPLKDGSYELRMNMMYLIIGVSGIIAGLFSLMIPVLANEYSVEIFVVTGFMFLLFMGFALPCFLWYKNHYLVFNEEELIFKSAYGRKQKINWNNIDCMRFNSFMGVADIIDKQGNVAKAHQHLVGFPSFVRMLQVQKNKFHFASEELPLKTLGLDSKTGYTQ